MEYSSKILVRIVGLLFLITPFVMSTADEDTAMLLNASYLPSFVPTITSALRWGIMGILLVVFFYNFQKGQIRLSNSVFFLILFYALQLAYALVDGEDYSRFFALTALSFVVPPVLGLVIQKKILLKFFAYCILFFLFISYVLNGHMILSGQRFIGFMTNANTMGISTVFWLVILLIARKAEAIRTKFFIVMLCLVLITMFVTGSRNAFVGIFLILFIYYLKHRTKLITVFAAIIPVFFALSLFIDISFLTDRFINVSNAVEDSGRREVWENATFMIDTNLWWGNGMANEEILRMGNMHNVYIRFLLNMGLIFTVLSLVMYMLSIVTVVSSKRFVPLLLPGYLFVYALMNLGEDFFVGLGSSAFIYMLFIYGFINYYLTRPAVY